MAKLKILKVGDSTLRKVCRPVDKITPRILMLLDDMVDTMRAADGVGLAAPQVGILRRAVIVLETNVEEDEDEYLIELINPEIIEVSGEEEGPEGCLSVPGEFGLVIRPTYAKVRAQDRFGEWFEVEGEGLTARCFCHEIDHLEGILYTSKCTRMLSEDEIKTDEEEE